MIRDRAQVGDFYSLNSVALRQIVPSAQQLHVTFVHERCTGVFEPIAIWRIRPHRHKNDLVVATQAEVHALLQTRTLAAAHLYV